MTFTFDVKPLLDTEITWNGVKGSWEGESRSWDDYGTYSTYTFDTI